ncbi:unnamed protein product [Ranitomeya imitator]|uniref:Monocarboxylate transporter 6 n=1 Tax=Ranitomeya imitator TaxID=111125 RepID=A0ABN9M065_9NEOB|nr:unnamed protein product [Ranitomeya imitator]
MSCLSTLPCHPLLAPHALQKRLAADIGGFLYRTQLKLAGHRSRLCSLPVLETGGNVHNQFPETGLGLCFCFQAAVTVLGYYFIKRRTLANAFASSGASIGMALWPIASQHLLESMGWRGSFMIFGGVLLNCCVCGAMMRPVKAPPAVPSKDGSSSTANGVNHDTTELEHGKGLQRYMAFDLLLRHRRYQIYTIGVTWLVLGFVLPLFYFVPYATSNGFEDSTSALLLSLIGFINIFARPVAGLVSQQRIFSGKLIYLFSGAVIANGLSNLVCATFVSFPALIVYCVLYGISMSVIGSLIFQVLMDIVGMKRFPAAFGLFTILESVTILVGPPLAGLLVDITGQYNLVFYFTCSAVTSSGLFMFLASYILDKKKKERQKKKFITQVTPLGLLITKILFIAQQRNKRIL